MQRDINPPAIECRSERSLADLATDVKEYLARAESHKKEGAEYYRLVGERLLEAKGRLPHGEWGKWLKDNVPVGQRQAQKYMQLANASLTTHLDDQWRVILGNVDSAEDEPDIDEDEPAAEVDPQANAHSKNPVANIIPPPERPAILCEDCRRKGYRVGCQKCAQLSKPRPGPTQRGGGGTTKPPAPDATSQSVARPRRRWEKKFLAELRRTGNHSAAARVAKIDRTVPYKVRQEDPEFAAAYDDAMEEACDGLELEARRRAHDGIDEPVIYRGQLCGSWVNEAGEVVAEGTPGARLVPLTVKKYSDSLLLALLKAHRPQRFRDGIKLEHTGPHDGQIRHDHSGSMAHKHHLDPAVYAAFCADLRAAGLGHLLLHGRAEPVDSSPASSEAAALPAPQRDVP
jgi:hypothetical protein